MSSEKPNNFIASIPRTPSNRLPSSSFVTPEKFNQIREKQIRMSQQVNTPLNSVEENSEENKIEQEDDQNREREINSNSNSNSNSNLNIDNNENNNNFDNNFEEQEEMKRNYDLNILQLEQEKQQMHFLLQQLQQENAHLQYQQRMQFHHPQGQPMNSTDYSKLVGKPEYFTGDFKSNPNVWIDQMNDYMTLTGIHPSKFVQFSVTFLREQARVWWSSLEKNEKIRNEEFNVFSQTLLAKYRPIDQGKSARAQLKTLKQINSVSTYNNLFSNVIQLIHDMALADQLEFYKDGLKRQVFEKMVLEEFDSLAACMNAAAKIDAVIFKGNGNGGTFNNNRNGQRSNNGFPPRSNGTAMEVNNLQTEEMNEQGQQYDDGNSQQWDSTNEVGVNAVKFTKLTDSERARLRATGGCFKCRQHGHLARNCPTINGSSMKPSAPISNSKKY